MRHWLIKFAPFRTCWADIVRIGKFTLRGVRSAEARKHLAGMRVGDAVLFYQSQQNQAVVGILEVVSMAYPDPTSADSHWLTCDFVPVRTLGQPVTLGAIKRVTALRNIALIRQPRLPVMELTEDQFTLLCVLDPSTAPRNCGREHAQAIDSSC